MTTPRIYSVPGTSYSGYDVSGITRLSGRVASVTWGRAEATLTIRGSLNIDTLSAFVILHAGTVYGPYDVVTSNYLERGKRWVITARNDLHMEYLLTDSESTAYGFFIRDVLQLLQVPPYSLWLAGEWWTQDFDEALGIDDIAKEKRTAGFPLRQLATYPPSFLFDRIFADVIQARRLGDLLSTTEPFGITVEPYFDQTLTWSLKVLPLFPLPGNPYQGDEQVPGLRGTIQGNGGVGTGLTIGLQTPRGETPVELKLVDSSTLEIESDQQNQPGHYIGRQMKTAVTFFNDNIQEPVIFTQGRLLPITYLPQVSNLTIMTIFADVERWKLQHSSVTVRFVCKDEVYLRPRHRIKSAPDDDRDFIVTSVLRNWDAREGYRQTVQATLRQPLPSIQQRNGLYMR